MFWAPDFRSAPIFLLFLLEPWAGAGPAQLDFNRDIRPILSENCFYCHGQDPKNRKADLRLDEAAGATRDLGGYAAIVPGQPEASALIERIMSDDRDEKMPPPKSNRHLTPEQTALLKRWISEGARYQKHWAFTAPERPPLPEVKQTDWPHNAVDRFILARLESEQLAPAAEAKPETWLRRASLDLIGLPPTPQEIDAFTRDAATQGEAAYESAADRLLASPHFGERMAIDWMDAARYADTHGFNNDSSRNMWRWRDWVIEAFNSNKPYNQFIIEQLAGDLLPMATFDQRLATGFCRNHVINSEGGIIDEEYRVEYVADRVRTLSMAWLGLTLECSRCHDHKYDPITQRDYYQLFSFFNNVPETGEDGRLANAAPIMPAPTPEQAAELSHNLAKAAELDQQLNASRERWKWQPEQKAIVEKAIADATEVVRTKNSVFTLAGDEQEPVKGAWSFPEAKAELAHGIAGHSWSSAGTAPLAKIEGKQIDFGYKDGVTVSLWLNPAVDNPHDVALLSNQKYDAPPASESYGAGQEIRLVDGEIEVRINERFPAYAIRVVTEGATIVPGEWRNIIVTYSGGKRAANVRAFVDDRELVTRIITDGVMAGVTSAPYLLGADGSKEGGTYRGRIDDLRVFNQSLTRRDLPSVFAMDALPNAMARLESNTATARERGWLRDAILSANEPSWREIAEQRDALWEKHLATSRSLPTSMVMIEASTPRQSFVLDRGRYDVHGAAVEAGVPEQLLAPWPKDAPRNRLGLALWLTQPTQPLTGRVVVNRFWAQLFGTGIVKTLEDFGSQGEWPTHPELLDWLARDFIDGGWNVKALMKTLVLSATYRQSSTITPALLTRDPENRLLTRGPRVRLPAEVIRDQALAISGLLRERIGGPSVFPYQPAGLYNGIVVGADYPGTKWTQSTGDDLYRRSLYTFWKRTAPHPAMLTFDAPDREFCSVRRSRTNTPLQALVLMNDPTFIEASRKLGERMLREGGTSDPERIAFAFCLATGRTPSVAESAILERTLARFRDDFRQDGKGAGAFLTVGASKRDPSLDVTELAAASAVANLILNLDETITKH